MGMATTESQFHVLAVDDSIIDRKLIERLLKTSSYQVTTVDSGSKALEFLGLHDDDQISPNIPNVSPDSHQEVEVNLVITDYCMPGMTGYDLLKKIKESSSLRNIPVVIMSSENVPARINRCLEEGAEEFFLKPVRLADVNRLKPHIMKAKAKDHKQEKEEPHLQLQEESAIPELHLQLQEEPAMPELHLQLQEEPAIPQLHLQLQEEPAIPQLHLQLQEESARPELNLQLQEEPAIQELHLQLQESAELEIELQGVPVAEQEQSNKRKTKEEGISPADRTRPRFTGLTTMV